MDSPTGGWAGRGGRADAEKRRRPDDPAFASVVAFAILPAGLPPGPGLRKAGEVIDPAAQVFQNLADLRRCASGLRGRVFNLASNDRKTLAGVARAHSLDRRVQRQKIGLFGDRVDLFGNFANLRNFLLETGDFLSDLIRPVTARQRNVGAHPCIL